MTFFECQFPVKIGIGVSGGPSWSTIVNKGFSGFESRNQNWSQVRNKYQLDLVAQPLSYFQTVMNFFLAVNGMKDGFRLLDLTDYQATQQSTSPATGDGSNKIFQLQKVYIVGAANGVQRSYTRNISKPIMGHLGGTSPAILLTDFQGTQLQDTVLLFDNGAQKVLNTDYTVDATTGLVTFTTAPTSGHVITWTGQYHIPVRFDSDDWVARAVSSIGPQGGPLSTAVVTADGIRLIEVLIPAGSSQG